MSPMSKMSMSPMSKMSMSPMSKMSMSQASMSMSSGSMIHPSKSMKYVSMSTRMPTTPSSSGTDEEKIKKGIENKFFVPGEAVLVKFDYYPPISTPEASVRIYLEKALKQMSLCAMTPARLCFRNVSLIELELINTTKYKGEISAIYTKNPIINNATELFISLLNTSIFENPRGVAAKLVKEGSVGRMDIIFKEAFEKNWADKDSAGYKKKTGTLKQDEIVPRHAEVTFSKASSKRFRAGTSNTKVTVHLLLPPNQTLESILNKTKSNLKNNNITTEGISATKPKTIPASVASSLVKQETARVVAEKKAAMVNATSTHHMASTSMSMNSMSPMSKMSMSKNSKSSCKSRSSKSIIPTKTRSVAPKTRPPISTPKTDGNYRFTCGEETQIISPMRESGSLNITSINHPMDYDLFSTCRTRFQVRRNEQHTLTCDYIYLGYGSTLMVYEGRTMKKQLSCIDMTLCHFCAFSVDFTQDLRVHLDTCMFGGKFRCTVMKK